MRLDVGILAVKQLLRAVPSQVLHRVRIFASAVITFARIAFGVLIGEDAARGFEHRLRREILTRDQLQPRCLPRRLLPYGVENLRIDFGQRPRHALLFGHDSSSSLETLSTRRWWRPPSKGVSRKMLISSEAAGFSMKRAPSVSTLASLCWRTRRTSSGVVPSAARMPWILLA